MVEPGFEILYEDGPCLAVCKPAGIQTQAPPGIDNLELRVRAFLKAREQKEGNFYLAVPHRLDRPVSGAMILARNVRAAQRLSKQFERREISKTYWALVQGKVEPAAGTWRDTLWKVHGQPRSQVVAEDHPEGQPAVLHYRTLSVGPLGGSSLVTGSLGPGSLVTWLEIELETGRTHQIRVQAASRGYIVLGDEHYGSPVPFGPTTDDFRQRAIALHGRRLGFFHPMTREPITVEAPLPSYWQAAGVDFSPR
jgi:23S rRNA pseudouridine1911/1915/1917 synthase